jgi:NADPH2:quinone reductase
LCVDHRRTGKKVDVRAVVCDALGAPAAVLRVAEQDEPVPGAGQFAIEVRAAGVNFADGLFVTGEYQIKPQVPFVPGGELAGTVTALGDGVTEVAVGDRVIASIGLGAFAEHVLANPFQVEPLPDNLTFEQGASFVQSYCTALFALDRRANLQEGETLLVLGASGGVGRAAVDVGKALGARVIAAASSPEKLAVAQEAGADATIDYSTEDLKSRARELSDGGVDVVYDPVGGDKSEPALRALGTDGRFLVIGFAAGRIPRVPLNLVLLRNRRVVGVDWGAWMLGDLMGQRALLEEALALAAAGKLHPPTPATRPLDEAGTVLADVLGGRVTGKVVLVP